MITPYDLYQQPLKVLFGLALVTLWSLVWQGIALWYAAQEKKKGWFIALLILNTVGLLPIIYLIWFRQKKEDEKEMENDDEPFVEEAKPKAKRSPPKKKGKKVAEEKTEE
ncbi:hypothetical protein HYT55_01275 [Candidatus Woesearchaeota archaeon]|nr:hypothetical protein [Candidatus Woesearchaeota archaeon]